MASAGIPQDPDRPLHGLVRLADASQGSQTFATRDQARDFKHDLLARLARGSWVDPQLGRQTFEAWAREWWEGWSGNADYSPRTLQAAEARLRRYLRRLGLSDDGGRGGWLPRRLFGRGKRGGSPGRNDVPERLLHDEWTETTVKGGRVWRSCC